MSEPIKSLNVALWALPDGPNTQPRFLGCHGITTVNKPKGTNTLNFCPDPVQPGKYQVSSKVKGPPGLVTFTIDSKVYKVFDYLDGLGCAIPLIAQAVPNAPKNEFFNWDRTWIFVNADNTEETINNLASMGADNNEVTKSFPMEADDMLELIPLRVYRDQDIAETQALNHIFSCDAHICTSEAGVGRDRCDKMYAVGDAIAASAAGTANVWIFENDAWTAAAADPFGTGEDISTGVCFPLDANTTRILVFRGTTDVGNPAECAYSDDDGATWTRVNIGSDNGEFVPNAYSAFALNQNNIWVGTDSGRIYFSNDGGATWTVQENAGIHNAAWNWIQFIDERTGFAGGAADVIAATVDGGQTWSQLALTGNGGDILSGAVIDANRVWVGTDDGELFYTNDGGLDWNLRSGWSGSGTGDVKALHFENELVGYMLHNDASPKGTFLMTRNGGFSWEVIPKPQNAGVNSMLVCSNRLIYGVGEPQGSAPVIYKLQPVG